MQKQAGSTGTQRMQIPPGYDIQLLHALPSTPVIYKG